MVLKTIEGNQLADMFVSGANNLSNHSKKIDALNVFPVPDGDTGTNMNLTITSGVKEVKNANQGKVSDVANAFAKGLLMGARGNSGVILSQLFRGFSKALDGKSTIEAGDLTNAFDYGVNMAYKAVMKPVEGTILTVAKDAAAKGKESSKKQDDVIAVMADVLEEAKASLERTPDLLPILKEVGVVDSGGQGLVTIYEGFLEVLKGGSIEGSAKGETPSMEEMVKFEHHSAQSHMDTDDIEFQYCTEVMVRFQQEKLADHPYDEPAFRELLSEYGDSLLVVSDDDLLKIHVHTDLPGDVINEAQKFGALVNIKAEDMKVQHSTILEDERSSVPEGFTMPKQDHSEFAVITVAMGKGIADLFESLGVAKVIEGGQTMNPSTEDFIKAIDECGAKKIILLPNNSNIIMAAQQAADVAEHDVQVVPSKSVPQGLASMLAFNREGDLEETANEMQEAMGFVKTGEVTYAVRDTSLNGVNIKEGDFMGIHEKTIVASGSSVQDVARKLMHEMIDEDSEIVTLIRGEDRTDQEVQELSEYIEATFDDVEVEIHTGDQPLYSYIVSVE
ncbi:DAK2 domain-containing protein [Salisediminibacterium selenitireducens]|uniref:DAK2 domain fusion protein YloV n=1 Tax=Bacillus selenitireducens (strain ATCC 700615 / DSM 15326 / MLS10) TaxID=439292 RepID=D6XTS4_BACIE|nr:DAK2 domain-containing protein [Salisediminibacterium selenitireducens]ADH99210.1 DAK2 domain fusion protein YloV [[Bacillus] selenitireducens MLS10]